MVVLAPLRTRVPLLIVLVTVLFFFPAPVGSFQATHGPTSTLKECLMGLLVQALIAVLAQMLPQGLHRLGAFGLLNSAPLLPPPDEIAFSLRC